MNIIILGSGQVGTAVAEALAGEANDITVVDNNLEQLEDLKDRLDIRTVQGSASYPNVLQQAGAEDADMLIAVTSNDEINMLACQVAYTLYHTPHKICRILAPDYLSRGKLFNRKAIPIDEIISPQQEVTNYIRRLIKYPGSLQVLNFADDKVQLVGLRTYKGGPLIGMDIETLYQQLSSVETNVAAIYRDNRSIVPDNSTVIEADDEVFFIAAKRDIRTVLDDLRRLDKPYKNIMIAGGGNIGARLAQSLEDRYQVKILERDAQRCEQLAEMLNETIVLHGEASDKDLILEENIEKVDIFCAITNDDETNIMSAMLAKRLGARKVMCLINNAAYVDLVQSGDIDIAISPQQITISRLLRHVRRGDVAQVHSLRRGVAEAIEVVAHGDSQSSKVVGKAIQDLPLPEGSTVGALVRGNEVLIARGDLVVESDDHLVIFLPDKARVSEVERLFQVGLSFF